MTCSPVASNSLNITVSDVREVRQQISIQRIRLSAVNHIDLIVL
ncbi:hypothetical protein [Gimesia algae]|uniref:Uncharacterized protein n=1 Tax=Gimesia algae TaxID=2527971 RepID=A0A517VL43_9PLAN|nr:hypothetical protein [Gimesia algae]QDT93675.1 hypothetical protein Pan161_53570 [Gimesia algae]